MDWFVVVFVSLSLCLCNVVPNMLHFAFVPKGNPCFISIPCMYFIKIFYLHIFSSQLLDQLLLHLSVTVPSGMASLSPFIFPNLGSKEHYFLRMIGIHFDECEQKLDSNEINLLAIDIDVAPPICQVLPKFLTSLYRWFLNRVEQRTIEYNRIFIFIYFIEPKLKNS